MARGRPSSYDPQWHPAAASLFFRAGVGEDEMSRMFGITWRTFTAWKEAHPEFLLAVKEGKAPADAQVESKLYKRAVGYDVLEVTEECDGSGKVTKRKTVTKHMAPDPTAQIFWLKNRRPDLWRDRHDFRVGELSDEDLITEAARIISAAGEGDTGGVAAAGPDAADCGEGGTPA